MWNISSYHTHTQFFFSSCHTILNLVSPFLSFQGDLLCYQRSGTLAVPGCVGAGTSGKDYCAKRATDNTLFLRRNNGNMGACDGNCQEDTDCEGNLVCESPNGSGEVEGCIGLAISSVKYCKYPSLVQSQSSLWGYVKVAVQMMEIVRDHSNASSGLEQKTCQGV